MIYELRAGSPSSLKAMTPAAASSPISVSSLPFLPLEMQPMGSTLTAPSAAAVDFIYSMAVWLSSGGLVLGMQPMVVKPPRAAALVPLAIVSFSSYPGSRR